MRIREGSNMMKSSAPRLLLGASAVKPRDRMLRSILSHECQDTTEFEGGGDQTTALVDEFHPAELVTLNREVSLVRVWGQSGTFPVQRWILNQFCGRYPASSLYEGMALAVRLGTTWQRGHLEVKEIIPFSTASRVAEATATQLVEEMMSTTSLRTKRSRGA
ncbi:MAG: hypothetical protein ACK4SL_00125 [Candidatus Paceibacteria bacterium]